MRPAISLKGIGKRSEEGALVVRGLVRVQARVEI